MIALIARPTISASLDVDALAGRMLLQVHDEPLFEVPDQELAGTAATAARIMEGAAHLGVPFTVETGSGRGRAEAH